MGRPRLDFEITRRGEAIVVRPAGLLEVATAPQMREVLLKAIADQPSAVIVDLDRLDLRKTYTLSVFGVVARRTAEWSGVPLVLVAGPSLGDRIRLHAQAIARVLPVCPTIDAALSAARQPQRRITRLRLGVHPYVVATARRLVAATCEFWDCPDVVEDAVAITSELVSNAVVYAGTESELRLELRRGVLTVSLVDGNPRPPVLHPASDDEDMRGGFGLRIVDNLASAWGWVPHSKGGKVVWAVIRTQPRMVGWTNNGE
jgi:anti-anti-sigma regulatory factor/anti-sigma regulatory factor (Ser/Thr protein kinase)